MLIAVLLLLKEGHKDPLFGEKGATLGIQYDIAQKRWMREEQGGDIIFGGKHRYSTWRVKAGTYYRYLTIDDLKEREVNLVLPCDNALLDVHGIVSQRCSQLNSITNNSIHERTTYDFNKQSYQISPCSFLLPPVSS